MNEAIYQTIRQILYTLQAVTAELHQRHPPATGPEGSRVCGEETCQALGRLEAQADGLRRTLGLPAFR